MAPPRARAFHPASFVRALRVRPRLVGCTIFGTAAYVLLRGALAGPTPALVLLAWNMGALLYLALAWHMMATTPAQGIRERAPQQDDGRLAILTLVVVAALAVLLAVGTQLAQVKDLHGNARTVHVSLAALT